jgi:hypothetical protein
MGSVRKATVLAALAAGMAAPASGAAAPSGAVAHDAGCTRAVIGGVNKCLRVGQPCSRRYQRKYQAKGFTCVRRNGKYTLRRQSQSF